MVLREKLEEYDAELRELESFDDNIFYRCEPSTHILQDIKFSLPL